MLETYQTDKGVADSFKVLKKLAHNYDISVTLIGDPESYRQTIDEEFVDSGVKYLSKKRVPLGEVANEISKLDIGIVPLLAVTLPDPLLTTVLTPSALVWIKDQFKVLKLASPLLPLFTPELVNSTIGVSLVALQPPNPETTSHPLLSVNIPEKIIAILLYTF